MAKRKTTITYKTKRTSKRKSRKPRASIKKYVKALLARNVENKSVQSVDLNRALYSSNSALFTTVNTFAVSPNSTTMPINQGTGQGDRIGNKIKTKKLTFKGTIVPIGTGATNTAPRPLQARILIMYAKQDPNTIYNPSSNLYQLGGTEIGPRNDLVDMWAPINKDVYTVLADRTIKLGFAQYDPTMASTSGFWSNNDFKLNQNFSFDLTKHYIQQVKYNDNNSQPTTRGLFCTIVLAYADGTAMNQNTIPCGMQYVMNYVYEDA